MNDHANQMQLARNAVENAVFIVGTMRSGTSFLGLQLNVLERMIGCPFELRKVWSCAGKVPMASDIVDTICPYLDENSVWPEQEHTLKSAFQQEVLINLHHKKLSINSHFLNKNPHLCNKLGLVNALFPNATFLWTLRSLTEVVTSLKNLFLRPYFREVDCYHLWPSAITKNTPRCFSVAKYMHITPDQQPRSFPGGDVLFLAEYWLESNLAVAKHLTKMPKYKRAAIFHDDLLQQPEMSARQLERLFSLPHQHCQHLCEHADINKTKQWEHSLTGAEKTTIENFERNHQNDIQTIYTTAQSFRVDL